MRTAVLSVIVAVLLASIAIAATTPVLAQTYGRVDVVVNAKLGYAFSTPKHKGFRDGSAFIDPPWAVVQIQNVTYVINLWTATVTATKESPIPDVGDAIVTAYGGKFYVVVGNGTHAGFMEVVPPNTFSQLVVFPLNGTVDGLYVDDNGVWAVAWDNAVGDAVILKWDASGISKYLLGSYAAPIGLTGNGTHLFVAYAYAETHLHVIDESTMSIVATYGIGEVPSYGGLAYADGALYEVESAAPTTSTDPYLVIVTKYDLSAGTAVWQKYLNLSSASAVVGDSEIIYDVATGYLMVYYLWKQSSDPAYSLTVDLIDPATGSVMASYMVRYYEIGGVVYVVPGVLTRAGNSVFVGATALQPRVNYDTVLAGYKSSFSLTTKDAPGPTPYSDYTYGSIVSSTGTTALTMSTLTSVQATPTDSTDLSEVATMADRTVTAYVYPDKVVFSEPVLDPNGNLVTTVSATYGNFFYLGSFAGEYVDTKVGPVFSNVSINSVTESANKVTITLATKGAIAFPTANVARVYVNGSPVDVTGDIAVIDPTTIEIYLKTTPVLGGEIVGVPLPVLVIPVIVAVALLLRRSRF